MSLRNIATSDVVLHLPKTQEVPSSKNTDNGIQTISLLFFITGNPGLISYYHTFLELLAKPINTKNDKSEHTNDNANNDRAIPPSSPYIMAGFSLGGFTNNKNNQEPNLEDELAFPPGCKRSETYSLRDQIDLCYARLVYLVEKISKHYKTPSANVNVILAGHSVGAYIALELVRMYYIHTTTAQPLPQDYNASQSKFKIKSLLLLTPTIMHIAQSSSGRIATPMLTYLPFIPGLLQFMSSMIFTSSWISEENARWLVGKVTGMGIGSEGLDATVRFLRCSGAVKQALCMARDEMGEIGGDGWGREVWGVGKLGVGGGGGDDGVDRDGRGEVVGVEGKDEEVSAPWKSPKMFCLFARNDHWVADVTRDEWVRGLEEKYVERTEGKPIVVIDENDNLKHAWCLEQSEIVAKRCRQWMEEILRGS